MAHHVLTVNVQQAHINAGKAGNCRLCPVALATSQALTLAFPDKFFGQVYVNADGLAFTLDGRNYDSNVADDLLGMLDRFDDHNEMHPFSFDLFWSDEGDHDVATNVRELSTTR